MYIWEFGIPFFCFAHAPPPPTQHPVFPVHCSNDADLPHAFCG